MRCFGWLALAGLVLGAPGCVVEVADPDEVEDAFAGEDSEALVVAKAHEHEDDDEAESSDNPGDRRRRAANDGDPVEPPPDPWKIDPGSPGDPNNDPD